MIRGGGGARVPDSAYTPLLVGSPPKPSSSSLTLSTGLITRSMIASSSMNALTHRPTSRSSSPGGMPASMAARMQAWAPAAHPPPEWRRSCRQRKLRLAARHGGRRGSCTTATGRRRASSPSSCEWRGPAGTASAR